MANDTKERILAAALEMFSKNGYAGTNIRELSASLGLVKSGVYKHYESKEAIWNALLNEMITYYGEHFGSSEHLPPVPDSLEALTRLTMQMVNIGADAGAVPGRPRAGIGDEAFPDRADGDIHAHLCRDDGQGLDPP